MEHTGATVRLVRAAQHGDRSAFAELYARYAGLVRAIALSRVSFEDAPDVVQETFLRALTHLKQLQDANSFRSWLSAIARNITRDVVRERLPAASEETDRAGASTQHEEMDARAARRAIRSLPKAYQHTLALRIVGGMTAREIAQRSGLSVGSVRVNIHRGMKLLRKRLLGRTDDGVPDGYVP